MTTYDTKIRNIGWGSLKDDRALDLFGVFRLGVGISWFWGDEVTTDMGAWFPSSRESPTRT